MSKPILLLLTFLIASSAATHAEAQSYEAEYEQGMACFEKMDCRCALSWFKKAQEQGAPPVVWYEIGEMEKCLQHAVEAEEAFTKYLAEPDIPASTRAMVESEVAQLDAYLAKLSIECEVAGAIVQVDGRKVGTTPLTGPVTLPPGIHVVTVTVTNASGSMRRELTLEEGQHTRIVLTPTRDTPANVGKERARQAAIPFPRGPTQTPTKVGGYVAIGVGAALGAASVAYYFVQRDHYETWLVEDARIEANSTSSDAYDRKRENDALANSIHKERVMTTLLGVSGGAFLAGGLTLLAWDAARSGGASSAQSGSVWTASLTRSNASLGWRGTW